MKYTAVSQQRDTLRATCCMLLQRERQIAATATLKDLQSITASQTALHKKMDILSKSIDSKVSNADMHSFVQTQQQHTAQVRQQLDVKVGSHVCFAQRCAVCLVQKIYTYTGSGADSSQPETGSRLISIAKPSRSCRQDFIRSSL